MQTILFTILISMTSAVKTQALNYVNANGYFTVLQCLNNLMIYILLIIKHATDSTLLSSRWNVHSYSSL